MAIGAPRGRSRDALCNQEKMGRGSSVMWGYVDWLKASCGPGSRHWGGLLCNWFPNFCILMPADNSLGCQVCYILQSVYTMHWQVASWSGNRLMGVWCFFCCIIVDYPNFTVDYPNTLMICISMRVAEHCDALIKNNNNHNAIWETQVLSCLPPSLWFAPRNPQSFDLGEGQE